MFKATPVSALPFDIFIPRLNNPTVSKEDEVCASLPGGTERILMVDDDEVLVEMGRAMLERLGYKVSAKNGSLEALEIFRTDSSRFDLVLTDQTMPKMTGAELSRELLKIRPDIPIILCTGFDDLITPEKAEAIGVGALIGKPLAKREVAHTIRRLLVKDSGQPRVGSV